MEIAAGCAQWAHARLEHRNLVVGLVMEDKADPSVPHLDIQPANIDAVLAIMDSMAVYAQ